MLSSPNPLHIPDGFLSLPVALIGWLLAAILINIALRQTRPQLGGRQVPLMGMLAAFIFAAQAINFPVAAGTSGHLLGGALAAIVLGPWAATLVMTAVIGVQALIFQDGGLLALGWNIINMGVLTAFTGYASYRFLQGRFARSPGARAAAVFTAAWLSVEAGAIATAIELAVSGTAPLSIALPAMAGVHALIGLGEGIISSGAVNLLQVSRPELLTEGELAPGRSTAGLIAAGLLVVLLLAGISPLAVSTPDGLEFVAESQGFLGRALDPVIRLLPEYSLPFIGHPAIATILAVLLGSILVFGMALVLGRRTRGSE